MSDRTSKATTVQTLRVFVIARSSLERRALRLLLHGSRGLTVVGEAGAAAEAIREISRVQPEIVLLDASLPRLPEVMACSPDSRVILMADDDEDGLLHAANPGIWGYLSKTFTPDELVRAIRLVREGSAVLSLITTVDAFRRLSSLARSLAPPPVVLSDKEMAVMRAIADGATDREIARSLVIAVPTVKTYVRSILKKTKTHNRAEAVAFGFRNGLLR
ncbi:MAG: response regulator transcription factor [Armatimonadetes bacterium]|nr:response regulator transcription factor [Armatimonadota bacterium]